MLRRRLGTLEKHTSGERTCAPAPACGDTREAHVLLKERSGRQALTLLRAWRAGEPVTATVRGTTIVSLTATS